MIGDDLLIDFIVRKLLGGKPADPSRPKSALKAFVIIGGFVVILAAITICLALNL